MAQFDTIMRTLGAFPALPKTRREPSEEDIAAFEELIGGKLPDAYRDFLAHFGQTGLSTSPRFPIGEPTPFGQTGTISAFFGFSTKAGQSIVEATMDTYAGRIPDPTIPIGNDALGNLILLGFAGPYADKVYFWDHEFREFGGNLQTHARTMSRRGVDPTLSSAEAIARDALTGTAGKPRGFENVYFVASTFVRFLEKLEPDPRYA